MSVFTYFIGVRRYLNVISKFAIACVSQVFANAVWGGNIGDVLPEAVQAWKESDQAVHSLRIEWLEMMERPEGWAKKFSLVDESVDFGKNRELVSGDLKLQQEFSLAYDGVKLRSDSSPKVNIGGFVSASSAFNGKEFKRLRSPMPEVAEFHGGIMDATPKAMLAELSMAPVLLAFKMCDATRAPYGLLSRNFTVERAVHHEGKLLDILSEANGHGASEYQIWLDPQLGYRVVRMVLRMRNEDAEYTAVSIDLQYQMSENGEYVPNAWQIATGTKEGPVSFYKANVTSCEVNPELEEELFEIEFPVGTMVTDSTNGTSRTYVVGDQPQIPVPPVMKVTLGERLAAGAEASA